MGERISDLIYFEMDDTKYTTDFANDIINSSNFYYELLSRVNKNDSEKEIERKIRKLVKEYQDGSFQVEV